MTGTDNRIDTITYKKHDIATYQDEDPQDPRDWDNISKICIRKHRNYTFPNELKYNFYLDEDEEDFHNIEIEDKYYIFELDSYEHGGITFSLTGNGTQCRFDTSKNCGFIAIPKGIDPITGHITENEDEALKIAKSELKDYNDYLNGNVYGYNISGKNCEDSCFGYFGREGYNEMIEEAKSNIDTAVSIAVEKHIKQVKAYIVNKVPLEYRKPLEI